MSLMDLLLEQQKETRLIIKELLEDGSDPDAIYVIEHHFSGMHFAALEKAAVEAFNLGYEVSDAEELDLDEGEQAFCFDVVAKIALTAELIDVQVEQMVRLADKYQIQYDGWGTYFEDGDQLRKN